VKMYSTSGPELFILALTLINVMNFIDRGIIPGATDEFTTFIDDTLDASSPSFYIGLLQSSFIIGICAASPVFATMAHTHNTFTLILGGMVVWTVSALISGSAYYINSYEVLLCGRMLSGVGEAAFMCCTSPWIATNARSASKSKWLAIFFSAMPIGTNTVVTSR
jgi:MFS family permease